MAWLELASATHIQWMVLECGMIQLMPYDIWSQWLWTINQKYIVSPTSHVQKLHKIYYRVNMLGSSLLYSTFYFNWQKYRYLNVYLTIKSQTCITPDFCCIFGHEQNISHYITSCFGGDYILVIWVWDYHWWVILKLQVRAAWLSYNIAWKVKTNNHWIYQQDF